MRCGWETVSSGFSTFSVLWAAGTHTAVAGMLALSAGTLMASAGTLYRLVPAHFYPRVRVRVGKVLRDRVEGTTYKLFVCAFYNP